MKTTDRGDGRGLRIAIFARKDLRFNTRIVRQAKALEDAGHRVTVVCLAPPSLEQTRLTPRTEYVRLIVPLWVLKAKLLRPVKIYLKGFLERYRNRKVDVPSIGIVHAETSPPHRSGRLREWRKTWEELAAAYGRIGLSMEFASIGSLLLLRRRFDLCQAHDSVSLRMALAVAGRSECPWVYDAVELPDLNNLWSYRRLPQWVGTRESELTASIIGRAHGIMTVSDSISLWMAERFGIVAPKVIRNCRLYEDVGASTIRTDCGLGPCDRLVLYLNSLYPGQGLEQLVESISLMPKNVHVATQGPVMQAGYAARLRNLALHHAVADRFHILTPKPPGEMLSYASGADMGVIPRQDTCLNNRFSLPNRVFELTMARLPFAVSDLPDMKGFVKRYGLGQSFDQTSPQDIARAVGEMLVPEAMEGYRKAVEVAAHDLCWENEGRAYVEYIEAIYEKHCAAGA